MALGCCDEGGDSVGVGETRVGAKRADAADGSVNLVEAMLMIKLVSEIEDVHTSSREHIIACCVGWRGTS